MQLDKWSTPPARPIRKQEEVRNYRYRKAIRFPLQTYLICVTQVYDYSVIYINE